MTLQKNRLNSSDIGKLIDLNTPCQFYFDGKKYQGYAGDTVASALLANGVRLFGRSFKYHRPRGVFTAGVEEPSALLTILHENSDGKISRDPNIRAPEQELYDGLKCESQNRFPSLSFDILSINRLLSRFMPAGFYYKTFMGPFKQSWMWFEPFIRRAAGLGKASFEQDESLYDHAHAFCDILIVGAGPAGISAALKAGASGARVILMEQSPYLGGCLCNERMDSPHQSWLKSSVDMLEKMPNIRIFTRTSVFGWYDHNIFAAVEKLHDHVRNIPPHQARHRRWKIQAKSVILATGALERPIAFGNNDLPGIMLASAARRYLNGFGVLVGRKIIIFSNDDTAYDTAFDMMAADGGLSITIVDARAKIQQNIQKQAEELGIVLYLGHVVVKASGRKKDDKGIKACHIAPCEISDDNNGDIKMRVGRSYLRLDCDSLLVAGGYSPVVHLHSQTGARPIYNKVIDAFIPNGLRADLGHFAAGGVMGNYEYNRAILDGVQQAVGALGHLHMAETPVDIQEIYSPSHPYREAYQASPAIWVVEPLPSENTGKAFLDFQNDVGVEDVKIANREGYKSIEHMKRYTTLGMATDQGKTSNMGAMAVLADQQSKSMAAVGTTTFRPPYTPVAIGALAGREVGMHFRPTRMTGMHHCHVRAGAKMLTVGAWMRPWYYPTSDDDTVGDAYRREMQHVRTHAGIVDVSTLGKIAVQGPDAGEFLNRVYINGFKGLAPGKCRYGVMLREDGYVLDDGTTTRLSENDYFMTTTTAEAAVVMSRLEFLLQCEWTDLRVHVTSVTDEWAGLALAGPKSRDILQNLLGATDVSNDALPFMGYMQADLKTDGGASLAVRIFRISFSGELAYEIYCRAGYGEILWNEALKAGEKYQLKPYGLEALGALRIEKGHVTASEIDGRHSLENLRFEGMASTKKPFLGNVLRKRPHLTDKGRPILVGLKSINNDKAFKNGSLIFEKQGEMQGHGVGYVTSTTWSEMHNCYIALGFLENGDNREGEIVRVAYPLKGEVQEALVTHPVFYDMEGEKTRG